MPQLLKAVCLESALHRERSLREKPTHCNEEWPPLTAAGESPRAAVKTQHSQKQSQRKSRLKKGSLHPDYVPDTQEDGQTLGS